MKAVFCRKYGPPEVLQLGETNKPVPRDNEILIKIHCTTVTVADHRIRSFTVPAAAWLPARLALGIRRPRRAILGSELAGEVEAVGKAVRRFKPGDQVFGVTLPNFGAYAAYVCLPESERIAHMPSGVSYEAAAAIPIGARTALHFLRKGNIRPEQQVLIYGASGSVGSYAVQLAKYFGAEVTGVCSSANLALVKSLGADRVIDYQQGDLSRQLESYDMVFVAVDKCPFPICNQALRAKGVYLNVTNPLKSLPMRWVSLTTKKRFIMAHNPPEKAEDLSFLIGLVEAGILRPVIDKTYQLEEIVAAHRYVDQGHKKGNVVIKVA